MYFLFHFILPPSKKAKKEQVEKLSRVRHNKSTKSQTTKKIIPPENGEVRGVKGGPGGRGRCTKEDRKKQSGGKTNKQISKQVERSRQWERAAREDDDVHSLEATITHTHTHYNHSLTHTWAAEKKCEGKSVWRRRQTKNKQDELESEQQQKKEPNDNGGDGEATDTATC